MNFTKKIGIPLTLGLFFLVFISLAWATPPEQNRQYGGGKRGPVVFSYDMHARLGKLVCADCHAADGTGIFESQRYEFTMKDHRSGKYCWSCHDGKQASKSCSSCHY